jgi:hypothetical protein
MLNNPHKRYCEQEIFGSDIMPFAVHLTTANLAAMDPPTTIDRTQIIHADTLSLSKGYKYATGIQRTLFPPARKGYSLNGDMIDVNLDKVDVILMNPPFTKVERGISEFVDMNRFGRICGNEVGLWGHFIAFADEFLNDNGVFGGVIPVSILRGKETKKIRDFVFSNWTPICIIKSTVNYGFSEWSEYGDILFVANKGKAAQGHRVKFVLLKKDLRGLTRDDIAHIANQIEVGDRFRSEEFDLESFAIEELREHSENLMWFCGASNMNSRNSLVTFIHNFSSILSKHSAEYLKTGYRPAPGGVSSFMFMTRASDPSRKEQAFLFFDSNGEYDKFIQVQSELGVKYKIEKSALTQSLRTGVGIKSVDITKNLDYIATQPYKQFDNVCKASGFSRLSNFDSREFWLRVGRELDETRTKIVTLRRINPYSPNTHLLAFCSRVSLSPSDQLNVIIEEDPEKAKALSVLINSVLFLSQFVLLKEETTGRYVDIRLYDYHEMFFMVKDKDKLGKLSGIFDDFAFAEFQSLAEQFDRDFEARYNKFWLDNRKGQKTLFEMNQIVDPSSLRLRFDMAVCSAVGVSLSKEKLLDLYTLIVNEMIITRGLKSD